MSEKIGTQREDLYYDQESHEYYDSDQIAEMFEDGEIISTTEFFKCEWKPVLKLNLSDYIDELIFDEFEDRIELSKDHITKIENLQKEIDSILKEYPAACPTKIKIQVRDII